MLPIPVTFDHLTGVSQRQGVDDWGVKSVSHRAIAVDENFVIGSPVIISHGISLGQLRASWKSGP